MTFIPNVLHLLAEQKVGPVTSIRFDSTTGPSLSINRDRMYILLFNTLNPTGVSPVNYQLFINNDTVVGNYAVQRFQANGGVVGALRVANATQILTLDNAESGFCEVIIIRDVVVNVARIQSKAHRNSILNVDIFDYNTVYIPPAIVDITRLDITASQANGIDANSTARLFRVSPI